MAAAAKDEMAAIRARLELQSEAGEDEIFRAAVEREDRQAIRAMLEHKGRWLHRIPLHLRSDPALQRAAVQSSPSALEFADALQSDYEVVRSCVERQGDTLQYASDELQADLDLARVATNASVAPLKPYDTSHILLSSPAACEAIFPDAERVDDEWIVHNKGKVADGIIHSSLTHIASKRYFIPAFDHMRGLAPPPGFSEIVKTSIGTGKVQLTVKILQIFDAEDDFILESQTGRVSSISMYFRDHTIQCNQARTIVKVEVEAAVYLDELGDDNCFEEGLYFELIFEGSQVAMVYQGSAYSSK